MVSMALSSPFPGIQEACASACTEEGLSVFSPSWVCLERCLWATVRINGGSCTVEALSHLNGCGETLQ